jgi:hypothetical protein
MGILDSKHPSYFKELDNILVDEFTSTVLQIIQEDNSASESKNIYIYPNMPLLYKFLKIVPSYSSPVLWYDVTNQNDGIIAERELDINKPEYIYWLLSPGNVKNGHFFLKRNNSAVQYLDRYLFNLLLSNKYSIERIVYNFKYVDKYLLLDDNPNVLVKNLLVIYPDFNYDINKQCVVKGITQTGSHSFVFNNEKVNSELNFLDLQQLTFSNLKCYRELAPKIGINLDDNADFIFLKLVKK